MVLKDRFKVIQIFGMKLRDIVHRVLSLKVFVFFFLQTDEKAAARP